MVSAIQSGDLETGSGSFQMAHNKHGRQWRQRLVRKIDVSHESENVDTTAWLFFPLNFGH